jgi:membrane protease YdiL (CAAX protease family)
MRLLVLIIVGIGFTFSYGLLDAVIPDAVLGRLLGKMSLWTMFVLISYSVISQVTTRRPMPRSIRWTPRSRWSVVAPAVTGVLAGLAILFPSPKHDRLDMLYIVAVAVVGEEVLFRGLLWDLVDGRAGAGSVVGLSGTVWLTALAFGVMHVQYHHFQVDRASVVQAAYAFAVGLGLGAIREGTGSLVPAVLAHSAFNSLLNLTLTVLSFTALFGR